LASSEGSNFSSLSMSAALGAVPRTGLSESDLARELEVLLREDGALLRELEALLRAGGALLRELVDLLRVEPDDLLREEPDDLLREEPDALDRPPPREPFEPDDEDRPCDLRLSAIPTAHLSAGARAPRHLRTHGRPPRAIG
jgi:hypothetical protein